MMMICWESLFAFIPSFVMFWWNYEDTLAVTNTSNEKSIFHISLVFRNRKKEEKKLKKCVSRDDMNYVK